MVLVRNQTRWCAVCCARGDHYGHTSRSDYVGALVYGTCAGIQCCIDTAKESNMTDDVLEQLKAIDQAVLTDVVRKDQHDPDLVILDWTVQPLSHEKII